MAKRAFNVREAVPVTYVSRLYVNGADKAATRPVRLQSSNFAEWEVADLIDVINRSAERDGADYRARRATDVDQVRGGTKVIVVVDPTVRESLENRSREVEQARSHIRTARAAVMAMDCDTAVRHVTRAAYDLARIPSTIPARAEVASELEAVVKVMTQREPEVRTLTNEAARIGTMKPGRPMEAAIAYHKGEIDSFLRRHHARMGTAPAAVRERLDAGRGPAVVDAVLTKIDMVFHRAFSKGVPGVVPAQNWFIANRMRAGAKVARKLRLATWAPSPVVWAAVAEGLRKDPAVVLTPGVLLADARRQLEGFPEYFAPLATEARGILDSLSRQGKKARPAEPPARRIEPRTAPYKPKGELPYAFLLDGVPRVVTLAKAPEDRVELRSGVSVAASDLFAPFSKFDEICRGDYAARIRPFLAIDAIQKLGVAPAMVLYYPQVQSTRKESAVELMGQGVAAWFFDLHAAANPDAEMADLTLEGPLGMEGLGDWQPLCTALNDTITREPPATSAEFRPWIDTLNAQVRSAIRENVPVLAAAWAPAKEAYVCWSDEVHAQAKTDVEARRLAEELPSPDALAKRFGVIEAAPWFAGAKAPEAPAARQPVEVTEHWSAAQRTKANLAAMELAATLVEAPTPTERAVLMGYSGWGGLSIKGAEGKFPASFPRPDPSGLIHEFYTPAIVANEIARLVRPLVGALPTFEDGQVQALEPSAGIGRMLNAFEGVRVEWHAVEWSELSYRMLRALRPDVDLTRSSFETWVSGPRGQEYAGKLGLVVSNPPYGARGASIADDPDRTYREKMAYHYFLRRALDLLAPGGLGVFLVPGGFLSGRTAPLQKLREAVLKRHHLACAFRLPSVGENGREAVFPGAMLVVDVLFFRARDGELAEVDPGDTEIIAGDYFKLFPRHVLGREVGQDGGEDDQTKKPRWGYQIQGDFKRLPELVERPICGTCRVAPRPGRGTKEAAPPRRGGIAPGATDVAENTDNLPEEIVAAIHLGNRVDRYLVALSTDTEQAAMAWPELHEQLLIWVKVNGLPKTNATLARLVKADASIGAARFMSAFDATGALIPGLRNAPTKAPPRWRGPVKDIAGQAAELYKRSRRLVMAELLTFHLSIGGTLGHREATEALRHAGWCLDGDAWDEWVPPEIYYTGALWPKVDRAMAQDSRGTPQARQQLERLMNEIKPAVFEDLETIAVRDGWVPLSLIQQWFNDTYRADQYGYDAVKLERKNGLTSFAGVDYQSLDVKDRDYHPEALPLLGYLNHDKALFKVKKDRFSDDEDDKDLDKLRVKKAEEWSASFMGWLAADPGRKIELMHAFNRQMRGYVAPLVSAEPLHIVRWSPKGLTPHAHQTVGARRVLENRRGMLAFDVGVGKTLTGLMILARARQEGWARRPVLLVPNTIAWKWHRDILKSLPDYRVAVIGSVKSQSQRGARLDKEIDRVKAEWNVAGRNTEGSRAEKEIRAEAKTRAIVSKTDSPAERAAKWTKFQAGEYDCVILTYSVFGRTRMHESAVRAYAEQTQAIQRELAMRRRNSAKKKKLSEREEAILREGMSAWVAEQMELPKGQAYDPGIVWDDLNVDFLLVDEAQNYKNLYLPEAREGGVPRFMGNAGDGSKRAWQLDFRAASVRRRSGGSGVVLLSATPAKNSPLEFYNVVQYIDPDAWHRIGVHDPEGFIDRFLKIEIQPVVTPKMEVEERGAVVGFTNLDVLRDVIFRYGDFKTAKDVGLVLPKPTIEQVWVDMDEGQDAKYDRYVREIEDALSSTNPSDKMKILGLLARMAMVAIHADLDAGYDWKNADQVSDPHSPKFDAMAERVLANRDCGHIVFCENVAAHRWIYSVLVKSGIAAGRIAFLNAEAVPGAAERQQIAMEFNGNEEEEEEPRFDVVICNSVAYEGIDLQTRTCAIHHIDLPWEPATLEQRNGRGVRQGNTRQTITVNYYMARRSQDGLRFNLIDGKAGWMRQLITSMDKETNNPGAQSAMTAEEVLAMISRNPEQTKARLDAVRQANEEAARKKMALEATRLLRAVNARFRNAEKSPDQSERTRLVVEARHRLAAVKRTDPSAWPFGALVDRVEHEPIVVVEGGGPLWSGLKLGIPSAWNASRVEYLEFGDVTMGAWVRPAGEATWKQVELKKDGQLANLKFEFYNATFPADEHEATVKAIAQVCNDRLRYSGDWPGLHWEVAPKGWIEAFWPEVEGHMLQALARVSYYNAQSQRIPVIAPSGMRVVAASAAAGTPGVTVIPPTEAGWAEFLRLAPLNETKFGVLAECGKWWWGRSIPRNLLSARDGELDPSLPEEGMAAKLERRTA